MLAKNVLNAKYLLLPLLILQLASCATRDPQAQARLQATANRPITCNGTDDCQVKWGKALQWVKEHCAYRFDQATDSLITTKGPLPDSTSAAYSITKLPQGNGKASIDFAGGCDNWIGCIPSMLEAKASFVEYVMGSQPQPVPLQAVITK